MAKIVVFGGTGYTGGSVLREAVARGHSVVSVSRSQPTDRLDGVSYEVGPAEQLAERVVAGADAVVAALAPRGDMAGRLVEVYGALAQAAAAEGVRYLQVGGFSSLRPAADQPRFAEGELEEQYRAEALEGDATRVMLVERAPQNLDWLYISPAGSYGSWVARRTHRGLPCRWRGRAVRRGRRIEHLRC